MYFISVRSLIAVDWVDARKSNPRNSIRRPSLRQANVNMMRGEGRSLLILTPSLSSGGSDRTLCRNSVERSPFRASVKWWEWGAIASILRHPRRTPQRLQVNHAYIFRAVILTVLASLAHTGEQCQSRSDRKPLKIRQNPLHMGGVTR